MKRKVLILVVLIPMVLLTSCLKSMQKEKELTATSNDGFVGQEEVQTTENEVSQEGTSEKPTTENTAEENQTETVSSEPEPTESTPSEPPATEEPEKKEPVEEKKESEVKGLALLDTLGNISDIPTGVIMEYRDGSVEDGSEYTGYQFMKKDAIRVDLYYDDDSSHYLRFTDKDYSWNGSSAEGVVSKNPDGAIENAKPLVMSFINDNPDSEYTIETSQFLDRPAVLFSITFIYDSGWKSVIDYYIDQEYGVILTIYERNVEGELITYNETTSFTETEIEPDVFKVPDEIVFSSTQ